MPDALWFVLSGLVVTRALSLGKFWRLPERRGRDWFLSAELGEARMRDAGAALLRRFRVWLLAPLAPEAVVVAVLFALHRPLYVLYEQVAAFVLLAIYYNLLVTNFAIRANALVARDEQSPAPTAVRLSLAPRRLRDHTVWAVEAAIAAVLVAAIALFAMQAPPRGGAFGLLWLLYVQVGLVLLKRVFVRWRMKLPMRRADDYTRWRTAWLAYHLHIFDAIRVICALALLFAEICLRFEERVPALTDPLVLGGIWLATVVALGVFGRRERARLAAVEREVQPATLVKEFPPSPAVEGRFFVGGVLFYNPNVPSAVARGATGIAINLANAGTYVWAAYLLGFVLLLVEQATA